jgi:hypothetical protein
MRRDLLNLVLGVVLIGSTGGAHGHDTGESETNTQKSSVQMEFSNSHESLPELFSDFQTGEPTNHFVTCPLLSGVIPAFNRRVSWERGPKQTRMYILTIA